MSIIEKYVIDSTQYVPPAWYDIETKGKDEAWIEHCHLAAVIATSVNRAVTRAIVDIHWSTLTKLTAPNFVCCGSEDVCSCDLWERSHTTTRTYDPDTESYRMTRWGWKINVGGCTACSVLTGVRHAHNYVTSWGDDPMILVACDCVNFMTESSILPDARRPYGCTCPDGYHGFKFDPRRVVETDDDEVSNVAGSEIED